MTGEARSIVGRNLVLFCVEKGIPGTTYIFFAVQSLL